MKGVLYFGLESKDVELGFSLSGACTTACLMLGWLSVSELLSVKKTHIESYKHTCNLL